MLLLMENWEIDPQSTEYRQALERAEESALGEDARDLINVESSTFDLYLSNLLCLGAVCLSWDLAALL